MGGRKERGCDVHNMPRGRQDLVDRRLFIPDTIWKIGDDGYLYPIHRHDDPGIWEAAVSADEPVITQVADFLSDGMRAGRLTSSSTAPWLMARMLQALDVKAGMAVLEIGTGTGWNAALLAAAGAAVTTVEIDQRMADHARQALRKAGFPGVEVVWGDGELGVADRAPYDRVIATAAVHTVPYPWVQQTVDGGLLVLPYTGRHHPCGLAVLSVVAGTASGRVVDDNAGFMPLRGQRLSPQEMDEIGEPAPVVLIEVGPHGQHVTAPA